MRCILHIGTEKTGSTAVQKFLFRNRSKLNKQGVHVCTSAGKGNNRALPAAFMLEKKTDDFLSAMSHRDVDDRRAWKEKFLRSFSKEVASTRGKADLFIISSEHFHSRLFSPLEVRELHSFLQPQFDEISVICYLRRQDQLALSRYSEALRAGHVPPALLPMDMDKKKKHRLLAYFDLLELLNRWAEAFGEDNIHPRVYSPKDLLEGDIVSDFLQAADMSVPHSTETRQEKTNIALSAEAQAILLGVNKKLRGGESGTTAQFRDRLVAYLENNAPGKSRRPAASRARKFYRFFEASNNEIARRWFNREKLFADDFSEYPDTARYANTEKVIEIVAGFLLQENSG